MLNLTHIKNGCHSFCMTCLCANFGVYIVYPKLLTIKKFFLFNKQDQRYELFLVFMQNVAFIGGA